MPTVSVIIPSRDRGWILDEAIRSVLCQDYDDFELLVVDDGSRDNTPALLASYPQIRVLSGTRGGVSAARNAGVAASTGRLIAFLDSDDLWLPGKLSAQTAFFERHPEAQICQTEEIWVRKGVRVNPGKRHQKPSGMIFERSVDLCLVSPSAVMMRRSLFESVGMFDETLPACEDYDLWLRVACRFPVYLIEAPLVVKRGGHADQLSRQPGLDRYRIRSLLKLLEGRDREFLTERQLRRAVGALVEKCAVYAAGCLKRGRDKEAETYLRLQERFEGELRWIP